MKAQENADYYDFVGFTFNDQHSSQFGILRTSDGNRYGEDFVPDLQDYSEEIPGGRGEYYFGEQIKKKDFKINFAYDELTESDLKRIKQWLHPDDKLHELIFDERPYVKYLVKCSRGVEGKQLCFNQKVGNKVARVYKGEGTIIFTAYMNCGIVVDKTQEHYVNFDNKDEWMDVAKFLQAAAFRSWCDFLTPKGWPPRGWSAEATPSWKEPIRVANLYNPGDLPTPFSTKFEIAPNRITLTETSTDPASYNSDMSLPDIGEYYALDDSNTIYKINISGISGNKITITDGGNLPETLYIGKPGDCEIKVGLSKYGFPEEVEDEPDIFKDGGDAYFTLEFPNSSTTNPTSWTEPQRALFYGGIIIIDGYKQVIWYKKGNTSEKVSLIDGFKQKEIFKIPFTDDDQAPLKIVIASENVQLKKYEDEPDPNYPVEYKYLYL